MLREPIDVRQATVADIPFMGAMMREALLASPTLLAHHDMDELERYEEQEWAAWPNHPDPAFIAVDADERALGALILKAHHEVDELGWQLGIGITAEARHQGIGRRLMERAIAYAQATNARYLFLIVDPTNAPAIALYRRIGFVEMGEREHAIGMRLDLVTPAS